MACCSDYSYRRHTVYNKVVGCVPRSRTIYHLTFRSHFLNPEQDKNLDASIHTSRYGRDSAYSTTPVTHLCSPAFLVDPFVRVQLT